MHRLNRCPILALLISCGCWGSTPLPPETEPTKGREALKSALNAWMRGDKLENFKGESGFVAWDPDWEAGRKLTKYEMDSTDKRVGVDLLVSVTLTLIDAEGKTRDKTVNFSVAIGAQTVVLRQT